MVPTASSLLHDKMKADRKLNHFQNRLVLVHFFFLVQLLHTYSSLVFALWGLMVCLIDYSRHKASKSIPCFLVSFVVNFTVLFVSSWASQVTLVCVFQLRLFSGIPLLWVHLLSMLAKMCLQYFHVHLRPFLITQLLLLVGNILNTSSTLSQYNYSHVWGYHVSFLFWFL